MFRHLGPFVVLWWGVPIGLASFAIGLITTTAIVKRMFAPIMGLALLFALAVYLRELRASAAAT